MGMWHADGLTMCRFLRHVAKSVLPVLLLIRRLRQHVLQVGIATELDLRLVVCSFRLLVTLLMLDTLMPCTLMKELPCSWRNSWC